MFIPREKMGTLNLPPLLSLLGATAESFSSLILPFAFFSSVALNSSIEKMSLSFFEVSAPLLCVLLAFANFCMI